MPVRDGRRALHPIEHLLAGQAGKPQTNRKNAHQRAVAITELIVVACDFCTDPGGDARQRVGGRHPDIKHPPMGRPKLLAIPAEEPLPHVARIDSCWTRLSLEHSSRGESSDHVPGGWWCVP